MLLALIQLGAFVALTASAPAVPWWASSVEHIIEALIVSMVPVSATAIRGYISHREHVQNLEAVRAATMGRDDIRAAIEEVHQEVKTSNSLKLGQMADDAESRRVGQIAPEDRTDAERVHLATIPEKR